MAVGCGRVGEESGCEDGGREAPEARSGSGSGEWASVAHVVIRGWPFGTTLITTWFHVVRG